MNFCTAAIIVMLTLYLGIVLSFVTKEVKSKSSPPSTRSIALHPERIKLLSEALSWLTLRNKGELLSMTQNKPFRDKIIAKYKESKYYRTFVIAFQLGVLPKLVLKEKETCNPAYTSAYKDPFNNSVTDHYIKNFTFTSYYTRNNPHGTVPSKICDYRLGLICNKTTSKCECPPGSRMSSAGHEYYDSLSRCLLDENQTCSLIDLSYWSTHEMLRGQVPLMIFNLEKPTGCQQGLQCRFNKKDFSAIPKCLAGNATDFVVGYRNLELGRKCALNLYTDDRGGMCSFNGNERLTCWDFGSRSHPNSPANVGKIGYCAREHGEFIGSGVSQRIVELNGRIMDFQPFVIPFVNPRSVPWTNTGNFYSFQSYLGRTDDEGLQNVLKKYHQVVQPHEQGVCSVEKTAKMEEIWRFYEGLEKKGKSIFDPTGTDIELGEKLSEALQIVQGPEKICRVNLNIERPGGLTDNVGPSLRCILIDGSPDADGNNGHCEEAAYDETKAAAERVKAFLDHDFRIRQALATEEEDSLDINILAENPESGCDPSKGPYLDPTDGIEARKHFMFDVLEGEVCPQGSVCIEDLGDDLGIYIDSTCELIASYQPQTICHSISKPLGMCERELLEHKVRQALDELSQHAKQHRGELCNYNIESKLRRAILDPSSVNGYVILNLITVGKAQGGFCDPTKLLECADDDKCECAENTEPRMVAIENLSYSSDYCYLSAAACNSDVTQLITTSSASQKEELVMHYASIDEIAEDCTNGNECVFLDQKTRSCTRLNTGKTGLEGGPMEKRPMALGPEIQFIAGAKSLILYRPIDFYICIAVKFCYSLLFTLEN